MKKLSILLVTLLINVFVFAQTQTITVREHTRSDGSTFTTATIKTEGEQFTQNGWAEGTGDEAALEAIENAQNSDSGSSNVKAGPNGEGDLRTGGPIVVITIGDLPKTGPKLPRGASHLKYKSQKHFRQAVRRDLAETLKSR